MRLSKKIAAVALAAVMSVSVLTACGGTDAPSSSRPSSSSSSSSSGADSSSSSSSSGSSSDSSSSSSGSGSSSNSSTEDKEETVAYKDSRTARFYQKIGTGYTIGLKAFGSADDENLNAEMLISSDGNRVYEEITGVSDGKKETQIILIDKAKRKGWYITPKKDLKEGKLGYYQVVDLGNTSEDSQTELKPIEGFKFKKETKGNYYIESQNVEQITEEQTVKISVAYYYEGNSNAPKYVEENLSVNGKKQTIRVELTSVEYNAKAKYMDFESILKQYVNVYDLFGSDALPSVAGLTIG